MAWETLKYLPGVLSDSALHQIEKSLAAAAQAAGMTLSDATATMARDVFQDFVEDGDVFDCSPLCWRGVRWGKGKFNPGPDGLEVVRVSGLDTALFTQSVFTSDVAVHARVSLNGASYQPGEDAENVPNVKVGIHWIPLSGKGYAGSVDRLGGLGIRAWPGGLLASGQLGYAPADEFLDVEFRSRDERLELRVWRAGEERPEEPQVYANHGEYRSGAALFASGSIVPPSNPLIVRSVRIWEEAP